MENEMSDISSDDLEDIVECDISVRQWMNEQSRNGKSVGMIAGSLVSNGVALLYNYLEDKKDFYPMILALVRDGLLSTKIVGKEFQDFSEE